MPTTEVATQRLAGTALAPPGSQLVLAEWTAQGSPGDEPVYQAPLHKHPEDEAWYVLDGTLRVRAGEQVHEISAGGAVIVPGETAHTFWNPRPDSARQDPPATVRRVARVHARSRAGGDGVVDVVDGERDTMQAQCVGRRVLRLGAGRRGGW